ncbi:MAG: FAD-dependent oxidoreductase [Candidatus Thermoplasmatota archaeon]|nr:FAD-dependent oxidoreductase [Candidatus Thermoplasmatota archaeon]
MKGNNPYFDITIIGAGVVGVCFAFWLTQIYDASILIVDKEAGVAYHQSSRNTGGVHRPLLMDPSLRIGRWQEESYYLWKTLAEKSRAPWITPGRLTIATEEEDVFLIEKYYKWGLKNGIPESELRYLVGDEISVIQPHVRGVAGIISTTESMTNYGILTNRLFNMAISGGVKFGGGLVVDEVKDVDSDVRVSVRDLASNNRFDIRTRLVVNAAGGASLRIAHSMGIGLNYFDIQLRGNYWVVDDPMSASIPMNIYPVTRHGIQGIDLSYTGPHLINRHDAINGWEKELGPTAAPVLGAYAYHNFAQGRNKQQCQAARKKCRIVTLWTRLKNS